MKGLVLMGGQSSRMGRDKAMLTYHDIPQWLYCAKLLSKFCDEVFWSCTANQKESLQLGDRGLLDKIPNCGPAGGLLSAFAKFDNTPWLVLACDFPNCDESLLSDLIEARSLCHDATAYANEDGLPEPFLSIWEIGAQRKLLSLTSAGDFSPRKALSFSKLLAPKSDRHLLNVNTPGISIESRQVALFDI